MGKIRNFMSMVALSATTLSGPPIITSYKDVEAIKKCMK
jgi:hypothetical protein